jgi:hypothetical protein
MHQPIPTLPFLIPKNTRDRKVVKFKPPQPERGSALTALAETESA